MTTSEALSLRVLQRWFVGMTTRSALSFERNSRATRVVDQWIKSSESQPAAGRLEIYREGYGARLIECLSEDYPVLKACMGEVEFEALSRAYIDRHPSRCPNLNSFGRFLPEFLASRPSQYQRFFRELARFEWALVQSVHAKTDACFLESLRTITPDRLAQLRFVPSESLQLFEFEYPVNRVVQAHFDGKAFEVPAAETTRVGVARRAMHVWRVDLDGASYEVVTRLARKQSLAEALCGISATVDDLHSWFATWVTCGFFASIE